MDVITKGKSDKSICTSADEQNKSAMTFKQNWLKQNVHLVAACTTGDWDDW